MVLGWVARTGTSMILSWPASQLTALFMIARLPGAPSWLPRIWSLTNWAPPSNTSLGFTSLLPSGGPTADIRLNGPFLSPDWQVPAF